MDLIGRADDVRIALESLSEGRSVLVEGPAGIGKSALLRHVAGQLDGRVRSGGGLEMLSWYPYLALVRAIGPLPSGGDVLARARAVERSVGEGVLLLDDVQWLDRHSMAVLRSLPPRVRILGAARTAEEETGHARELFEKREGRRIDLEPLSATAARELVKRLRPDLIAPRIERVVERAGRNPFYLQHLALGGHEDSLLVELSLRRRLDELSTRARDALARLGLAGRSLPVDRVGPGLDELVARDLVTVRGDEVSVSHDLVAEAAVASITETRRRRHHRLLADVLVDSPAEAARHAAAADEPGRARELALRAADEADDEHGRALNLAFAARYAPEPGQTEQRISAARQLLDVGLPVDAEELLGDLRPENSIRQAQAQLLRASAANDLVDAERAERHLAAGLELAVGTGTAVEVDLRSFAAVFFGRVVHRSDLAIAYGREALDLAERLQYGVKDALVGLGTALVAAHDPEGLDHLQRAAGDGPQLEGWDMHFLIVAYEEFGDRADVMRLTHRAAQRTRQRGHLHWEAVWRSKIASDLLLGDGEHREAREIYEQLLDHPLHMHEIQHRAEYALLLANLGELRAADEQMERAFALQLNPEAHVLLWWTRAEINWVAGRYKGAREAAERCLDEQLDAPWTRAAAALLAWVAWELGDEVRIHPALSGSVDRVAILMRDEAMAVRSLARGGDPNEVCHAFEDVLGRLEGVVFNSWLRCRLGYGLALFEAGRPDSAQEVLYGCEGLVVERELDGWLPHMHRTLRKVGIYRAAPRESDAVSDLTAREREVLELVAQGLTSRDIAQRLGTSENTVETQVRSATDKLDARTRIQAVAKLVELERGRGG